MKGHKVGVTRNGIYWVEIPVAIPAGKYEEIIGEARSVLRERLGRVPASTVAIRPEHIHCTIAYNFDPAKVADVHRWVGEVEDWGIEFGEVMHADWPGHTAVFVRLASAKVDEMHSRIGTMGVEPGVWKAHATIIEYKTGDGEEGVDQE